MTTAIYHNSKSIPKTTVNITFFVGISLSMIKKNLFKMSNNNHTLKIYPYFAFLLKYNFCSDSVFNVF